MQNLVNWVEIPASDFKRAVKFYSTILSISMSESEFMGTLMGFFPADGQNVSGAVVKGDNYQPGGGGVLVYLNGGDDLNNVLDKVEGAGGTGLMPKTQISAEMGYFAMFKDTEGNTMAVHSMN